MKRAAKQEIDVPDGILDELIAAIRAVPYMHPHYRAIWAKEWLTERRKFFICFGTTPTDSEMAADVEEMLSEYAEAIGCDPKPLA